MKEIAEAIRDIIREIGTWGDDAAKLNRMYGLLVNIVLLLMAATAFVWVIKL